MNKSHLIFGDESGYDGSNRFGCLAKVSGPYDTMRTLNTRLQKILDEHNISEIKFHKVKGFKYATVAKKFLDVGLEEIAKDKIKANVIVWDKQDSRHDVKNRCDIENLKRMYYHNLKNLKLHWSINTTWGFYPDEFSAIKWESIIKYIENTRFDKERKINKNLFGEIHNFNFPQYKGHKELDSKKYPLLQLADLFAGVIRTSRDKSKEFKYHLEQLKNQYNLFPTSNEVKIPNNLKPKLKVLESFKKTSGDYKLGVNFSQEEYFKTFNMSKGIFIHHYKPQSIYDKAPTKK